MIRYQSPLGVPCAVGTAFRQRRVHVRSEGEFGATYVVSVVDARGGQVIEAWRFTAHTAVVAVDVAKHSLPPGSVLALVRELLDVDGWQAMTVRKCRVVGCDNGRPLWSHADAPALQQDTECMPCRARTVLACLECGLPDDARYEHRERLLRYSLCHRCDLWLRRAEATPPFVVTPEGHAYSIGDGRGSPASLGFGGQPWVVRFFDGRVVETNDLWSSGEVPEWFRARLPANATVEAKKLGCSRGFD